MSLKVSLMVACVAISVISPTIAQLVVPPNPIHDITKCWSSFLNVDGCVPEIFTSFLSGRVGLLGPACCNAIKEIRTSCWPAMFPFSPLFPPLLRQYCANVQSGAKAALTASSAQTGSKLEDASLNTFGLIPDVGTCIASLQKTEGCLNEVVTSFFSFQVRLLGPACCRAINAIDNDCWPKVFPFNPYFPPLVKTYCTKLGSETPTKTPTTALPPMTPTTSLPPKSPLAKATGPN
ncbi:hypothetical protein IFM89_006519 [Coptis chinensis]|uniref:Prolamin-like domain-containing protein n=1 Tax=Coptis chinensis TaxID=261450 RepID=A0A835IMP0_9MAGN|nr:hypothetical protein IFM89_006519 [Coptis chinensis]